MFDVLDRPLLWIPMQWPSLKPGGPDGSGIAESVENEIEIRIEIKDTDAIKALVDPEDGQGAKKIDAFLDFVTDWRRVVSGGNPLPFNRETADLVIRTQPAFFDGFRVAYLNAIVGKVELREGNSDASRSDGPAGEAASETTANPKPSETANASE